MTETHNIIVASEFLRQYQSTSTRMNYTSILKNYFSTMYPCVKASFKSISRGEDNLPLLDEITKTHLRNERNYRNRRVGHIF